MSRRTVMGWRWFGQERPAFADEPQPGQESVWDYPRPPACRPDAREVVVRLGDREIARTTAAMRVLETASPPTFYLPPADVDETVLRPGNGTSWCEWKGPASYFDVVLGDETIPQAAWAYSDPKAEFVAIARYYGFYPGRVACFVAGERVRQQPGHFYGGWVTDEIVGPVKGGSAESSGW